VREGNIKIVFGAMRRIDLAWDMGLWRALLIAALMVWLPQEGSEFLEQLSKWWLNKKRFAP
jgi:hypothetical protein